MALLQLENVTQRFGGLVAVDRLDFAIDAGSIVAMIGPNGAGKSTVFNLITGIYAPSAGSIVFDGRPSAACAPARSRPPASPARFRTSVCSRSCRRSTT